MGTTQKIYNNEKAFTLIELMIVVAIIGILAATAIPAYTDYTIRAKASEGLALAVNAKIDVAESFQTGGLPGLASAAPAYNTAFVATKYVANIAINGLTGDITITYAAAPITPAAIAGTQVVLTPSIGGAILGAANGSIDWACGSLTTVTANARGIPVTAGNTPPQYMPTECK